uniref:Amino acid transporter transmembrane domain-containing protein n=1 Tax=Globodera rostochiensis TaxID=31243 RepID=A0A914I1T3_GLORO
MNEIARKSESVDRTSSGLHWALAAFFMVTDMSIGGMVSLPGPIFRIGIHRGLALLVLFGILSCCSAILLGRCWQIVLHRFPEYRQKHCRRPYAEIGFCALGQWMRTLVSIGVNATQFGVATVFLLLCAVNVRNLLHVLFRLDTSECLILLVLALLLLPLTLLKSPNEFWPILFGGLFCTVATFVIIFIGTLVDLFKPTKSSISNVSSAESSDFNNYLNAVGTMLFAFGGHPAMPTIQHDMQNPADFHKSAILGFSVITFFDFLVVLFACFAYGDGLSDSVVGSIRTAGVQQIALGLITANSLLAIILVINPLNQEAEEFFRTPQEFCRRRVLVRSAVLASVLFVAESVPNFGPFLGFVGSSTVPLIALILPFLFHLILSDSETQRQRRKMFIWARRAFYGTVIIFAAFVGCFATFSSLQTLFGAHFLMPCYL